MGRFLSMSFRPTIRLICFLLLTVTGLLAWEGLRAAADEDPNFDATPLRAALFVDNVAFYYKVDHDVQFLNHRQEWEARYKEPLSLQELSELAYRSYQAATLEEPFTLWREQGGPHPWVIQPKIHVVNNTGQAVTNAKVRVITAAKVGDYLADRDTLITDYDYLYRSAHWVTLHTDDVIIDVLAPGEEKLVDAPLFEVFRFLNTNANRWPVFLKITASMAGKSSGGIVIDHTTSQKTLELIPDHFIMPYPARVRILQ